MNTTIFDKGSRNSQYIGIGNLNDSSHYNSNLQHQPTQNSRIFFIDQRTHSKRHNKRCIYLNVKVLILKPLVKPQRKRLIKGNTMLSVNASPLSALFAIKVMVRKKKNLVKNM